MVVAVRDYRLPRPERVELGRDSLLSQRDEIALGGTSNGQEPIYPLVVREPSASEG